MQKRNISQNKWMSTGISPTVQADFTKLDAATTPSWVDNSATSGNRMVFDSTGTLTWAPANMLLNSATLSTQSVTTLAQNYILSFKGTGSVTCSGTNTTVLAGTGASERVSAVLVTTAGTLTLTVSGTVTEAQVEPVTYQTSPRAYIATTSAAVYQSRYDYDPSTVPATPLGMLNEGSRVNVARWSNDFTNAVWVKSNTTDITAAKDQTGIDGVANAASSLLCNVANGTVLQSITLASSARYQTCFVKRLVGTGVISMTMDGGSTWTDVTPQITSNWSRVSIATQTLANPQVGFKMATKNDKIAVQYFQNENGTYGTSTIPTTSSSVTRVADIVKLSGAALTIAQANKGSVIAQTTKVLDYINNHIIVGSYASSYRYLIYIGGYNNQLLVYNGTAANYAVIGGSGTWTGGSVRAASTWGTSGVSFVANNGTIINAPSLLIPATTDQIYLGARAANNQVLDGWMASLAFYNQRLPDAELKAKSAVGVPY